MSLWKWSVCKTFKLICSKYILKNYFVSTQLNYMFNFVLVIKFLNFLQYLKIFKIIVKQIKNF